MSPDTISSLFPDRPIRPLPQRRLKERLSPEVADAIQYPPSVHDTAPLFCYPPYSSKQQEGAGTSSGGLSSSIDQGFRACSGRPFSSFRVGARSRIGEEDEDGLREQAAGRSPPDFPSRAVHDMSRSDQLRRGDAQLSVSASSSVDGYDFFENTNNKKKRKIPSASDSAHNGSHSLNTEISPIAISAATYSASHDGVGDKLHSGSSSYPPSGSYIFHNAGFSGPGRGRLGRLHTSRSPLRALSDGNNSWPGRVSRLAASQWSMGQAGGGIISSAIANAEKMPPQGQENVSLLQQHSVNTKSTPSSTQFTFTCDSQVPGTVQWPGQVGKFGMPGQGVTAGASVGSGVIHDGTSKTGGTGSAHAQRKPRRRLERELNLAARHRRQMAAENYYLHPPKAEDIWICEFCEYERIFGEPPRALIRDYELKDRRHRKEEADRKRLLEKAKAKSRKGKKSGKAPSRGGQGQSRYPEQEGTPEVSGEHEAVPLHQGLSHSTQSEEEEYEDDFEDDYSSSAPQRQKGTADGEAEALPVRTKV